MYTSCHGATIVMTDCSIVSQNCRSASRELDVFGLLS